MERTSCLQHQANTPFFVFYQDVLVGCKRVYQRAVSKKIKYPVSPHILGATVRVLEVMTNRQRDSLVTARGCEPTELGTCEFFLTVSYHDFCYWSLGLYSESSFQHALTILEEEGVVESRYVVMVDAEGHPTLDQRNGHLMVVEFRDPVYAHVPKLKQYRLVIEKAQAMIDGTQGLPLPPPPPPPPGSDGSGPDTLTERDRMGMAGEEETGAPETTNHTSAPSQGVPAEGVTSMQAMPPHHHTSPTVKLLDPPRKTTRGGLGELPSPPRKTTSPPLGKLPAPPGKSPSNKESESSITREESLQKEGEESPSSSPPSLCAIFSPLPLDSPWEPETIIALYKGIVGPIDACDLEVSYHAALRLIAATSSLHSYDARYRVESELHYMTDQDSPSWWVKGRAVRTPVRLWHVADHHVGQWSDLMGRQWICATMPPWHEYMQAVVNAEARIENAAERHVEEASPVVIEEQSPSLPRAAEEPPGMEQATAEALLAQIDQESPPSVQLGSRKSRGGGIVVLVGVSASRIEALYDPSDWPALRHEIEEREAAWQSRLAAMRAKLAAGARPPVPSRERRRVA